MKRLALAFEDPEVERRFRETSADESRRQLTLGFGIALAMSLLMPHGRLVDSTVIPPALERAILFARYSVLVPACGVPVLFGVLASRAIYRRWSQLVGGVAGALAGSSVIVVSVTARLNLPRLSEGAFHYALIALAVVVMAIQTMLTLRSLTATLSTVPLCVVQVSLWPWLGFGANLRWYGAFWLISAGSLGMLGCIMLDSLRRRNFLQRIEIDTERARSEALLGNMLPAPIAARLKSNPAHIADGFSDVTILFADIVGFTDLSARLAPAETVAMLNLLFTAFDELTEEHGLEKIKTIGDAYMAVGGLPAPRPDHAAAVAEMALDMRDAVDRISTQTGHALQVRIGINSGSVVAGVIGKKKFAYDLWGDAVNVASRMESHGTAGKIQVTESTRTLLADSFDLEERGVVDVKGKGELRTWFVRSRSLATSSRS